ncbi:uncharacterized protein LODBEIA_P35930 [Lodderomyces beijingensis]|uniref:Arf-GAP domain-containing protein n=1 Tax=Lodderomyces beijingensis TaxID=1775926 RepID=A0ABP0ZMJ7_9ASCO
MGTHISKVKSVDLDSWTDDQIESMVQWGNDKCNGYWEEKLPAGYVPDQSKIENFIKTKYDLKKWCSSATRPDPNGVKVAKPSASTTAVKPRAEPPKGKASPVSTTLGDLVGGGDDDDDFGHFTTSKTSNAKPAAQRNSTPVTPRVSSQSNGGTPQPLQSAQSTGGSIASNSRPDLKKSILSLYASPSPSNSYLPQRNNVQTSANLSDSLSGLSFQHSNSMSNLYNSNNSNNSNNINGAAINGFNRSSTASLNKPQPPPPANKWANEWTNNNDSSTSSIASAPAASGLSLDDDLFKNVWN